MVIHPGKYAVKRGMPGDPARLVLSRASPGKPPELFGLTVHIRFTKSADAVHCVLFA